MGLRGHIGKLSAALGAVTLYLCTPHSVLGATAQSLANPGNSGTFDLSTGATWSPNNIPTNGDNVFIVFTSGGNGANLTLTNAVSNVFVADSLTITNDQSKGSGNLTVIFSGTAFFTSGVAQVNFDGSGNASAGDTALTFSSNVTFGAMNFIGNSANPAGIATLTMAGASQGNSLLFNGGGTESNYLVIRGTLGLTGTLTATNINGGSAGTISGNSTVAGVVFNNATVDSFTITNSTMSITGAVANVAGGFTLANNATMALSGGGGLIISNVAPLLNGTLKVNDQTVNGKTNWSNNGTVALAGGFIVGNNLTNNSTGTLMGYGNVSNAVVNLGTIWATNNTLSFASNIVQGGTLRIGSGSTISLLGSGALTNYGTINLVGASASTNAILDLGTVALTNKSGGTITGGGIIQNGSQVVNLSGGTILATNTSVELQFTNANTFGNAGTIGAATGATLTFGTALTGSAIITNFGTISMTGGTLNSGNITNLATGFLGGNGTVTAPVINSGIVSATNGELVLQGAASGGGAYRAGDGAAPGTLTFAGGGSINALFNTNATIQLESTVTNNSLFVNQGTIVLNAGTYQSSANFTNAAGESIIASDDSSLSAAGVINRGTILTTNALLVVSNLVVQSGTVTIGNGGTLMLVGAGALTNFGTINLVGAAGAGNNAFLNLGAVALTNLATGTITGGGIVQNGSQVVNLGTILATNTSVELQFTNASTVGNAGTIGAATGATLTFGTAQTGTAIITNFGTINLTGGTLLSGSITNLATGFLGGTGTVAAAVVNQGGRVSLAATISNTYLQTGSGSMTIASGGGTITGTATLNGGTLDLLGNQLTDGLLVVGTGATVTNSVQNATLSGGITNAGTVSLFRDTYINGMVTNTGTWIQRGAISNNVVNAGTMTLMTNSINVRVTGSLVNSGSLTFDTNGLVYVSGVVSNSGSFSLSGVISNNLVNSTGGSIALSDTATVTGNTMIDGGTLNLNGQRLTNALMVVDGSGGVVTNAVAGATVNGGISNASVIAVTANTFFNGAVTNTGAMFFQGAISNSLANSGSFNLNGGNGTITGSAANSGTINVDGDTLTVNPAWANSGTILIAGGTVAGGSLTNNSGATVSGAGTIAPLLVNNGLLVVTNGTLTLSVAPQQNGVVNVADGGAPGTLSVTPAWNNNGTVGIASGGAVTGGTFTNLSSGTVTNLGSINTLLVNQGRVVLGGLVSNLQQTIGTNTVSGAGTVSGTATVSGGLFDLNGGTYSNGLMVLSGTGVLTNSQADATFNGGLSNAATVALTQNTYFNGNVTNTGAFIFQGAISNNLVNTGNGSVTLNNTATITKTVTINGGTFNLNGQTLSNGLMIVDGGTGVLTNAVTGATVNGGVSNAAIVAVTADTFFNGPVTNMSAMFFRGAISNALVNNGSFNLNNNATLTVAPVNNGTIDVASSTLTVGPAWANAGSLQISGGVLAGGNVTNNSGEGFFGFGTISNLVVNNGTLTASGGTLTLASAPVQNGTAIVANASGLNVLTAWTNSGLLSNGPSGAVSGGTLTNTGTVNGLGFFNSQVVNQNRLNLGGTISNNLLQTAGSFTVSGSATITGAATIDGGTLDLTGNQLTDGQLLVTGTGVLSNSVLGATLNGGVSNAATVNFATDAYLNGAVTNTGFWLQRGAISNSVVNSGTMLVLSNTIAARITGGVVNSGSLTFTNAFVSGPVTNSGSFSFSGAISNNYVQAAGSLTLDNNGTVTGTASIAGGNFDLNGKTYSNNLMVVSGSGVLTSSQANATFNGGLSNAATVALTQNTYFNGNVTNTGTFLWQGAISNNFVSSGGTVTLNGNATITQNATVSGGLFDLNGKTYSNNLMVLGGSGVLTSSVAGASFNGALSNAATVAVTTGVFFKGIITNTGAIFFNGGSLSNNLVNYGTVTLNNAATVTGSTAINGGTLNLNGQTMTNGLLLVGGAGVVTNSLAGATVNGGVSNAGVIAVSQNTFFNGPVTNAGAFSWLGAISNSYVQTAGTNFLNGNATITQNATVNGGLFDLNGQSYSNSLMVLGGSGVLTSSVAGASFNGGLSNAATVAVTTGIFFKGIVTNTGAIFFNGGSLSNNLVSSGTVTLNNSATVTGSAAINGGTLNLNGQTMTNGLLLVSGTGVVTDSLVGATVNGGVSNAGVIALTANTIFNGPVTNTGALFFQGTISNNLASTGTVTLNDDSVVTGTAQINGGSLNVNGNDLSGGQVVIGAGALLTNGVSGGSVSAGLTNAGTVFVSQATFFNGAVTNTGTMFYQGAVSNNLVNSGNGSLTLNNSATVTGSAAINGGTLNLNGQTMTNGLLLVSGTGVVTNSLAGATINGGVSNAATIGVTANTYFNGPVTNTGAFSWLGAISNNFVQTAGTNTLNGASTITQNATVSGGLFNLNGQSYSNGLMVLSGSGVLTSSVAGASFNGALSNAATVAITTGVFFKGIITNTGAIFFNGGSLSNNLVSSGMVTLNNAATVTGSTAINGGTLNLNGQTMTNGLLLVGGAGVVTNSVNGATVNGGLSNAATISVTANTYFNGPVTNTGAMFFEGAISNGFVNSGNVLLNGAATITGGATVNGGLFDLNGQSYSNNLMVLGGSGVLTSSVAGASFNGALSNAATVAVTTGVFFKGIITNTGAIFFNGGSLSNNLVSSGTVTLNNAATVTGSTAINGGTLNLNGQTMTNALLLVGGAGVVTNSLAGATVNGGVSNAGVIALTANTFFNGPVTNTGGLFFQGAISNTFVNSGNGTVTLNNTGTFTQTLTINSGTLNLNGGHLMNLTGLIVGGSGTVTNGIAGASVFDGFVNNATVAFTADTFLNGIVTNNGVFFFRGAISNTLVNSGSFNLNNNATFAAAPVNTGTLNVDGDTLTINPAWANAGTVIVAGGALSGGNLTNNNTVAGFGTVNSLLVNAESLFATNGTLTASGGITNTATGQIFLRNSGTLAGSPITNAGSIAAVAGGNIGAVVNTASGTIQATNGTLTFLQNPANAGTINVSATAKFGAASELILTNNGVVNLFGGTILDEDLFNQGKIVTVSGGGLISNALVNDVSGFILSTNGTLVLTPDLTNLGVVTNSATLIVSNLAAATLGTVTNAGMIVLSGGTFTASTITNTATITGFGTVNATVLNVSGGLLSATNGVLNLSSAPTQNGTVNIATNATLNVTPAWANANSVLINGGVLAGGTTTNNVGASFNGFGTVSNNLVNLGTMTATNGTLNLINAPGQSGTAIVANNGTLNVAQAWQNSGTLNLTGGTVVGSTLTNAGAISGSGTFIPTVINTGSLTLSSGQTLTFTATTLSNAPTAVIQNTGGTLALTATNANFILTAGSGSNAFNFSSGTLLFSGATGTKTLGLAGTDLGSAFSATNNNYFIANLQLAAGTLQLAGGANRALYVGNLDLVSGETLNLDGFNIYYKTLALTNGVNFLNGTGANIIRLGSGGLFLFQPTSGTQDFDTGTNWDQGITPIDSTDEARITQASATSLLVTQNTSLAAFTLQDLVISNGGGGVSTLLVQRNQTWSNGGTIDDGGKIIVSNNVVLTAPVTVDGGTLNNNGTVNGLITVDGGTADGTYTNSGMVVVSSGTLAGFVLNQAAGVISNLAGGTVATTGILTNSGLVVNFGGVSNGLVNAANLDLRGGDIRGLLVNTSVISVTNGSASASGGITNAATGQIFLRNAGTLAGGTIINIGTIATLAGGNIDSAIINTVGGDIQGTNGTLRLGGKLTNLGSISVFGGATWNAVGGITNAVGANILLQNTGTLNGSTITNLGTMAAVAGGNVGAQVVNVGGGVIQATNQTLNLSGGLVNQSLFEIGNNLVNNTTAVVGNASSGVFDNSGGEIRLDTSGSGLANAAVLIVSNSYISSSTSVISNDDNAASILNFTANQTVTNNGTMSFTLDILKGGPVIDTNLVLIVGGGSNTFYNSGTFIVSQRNASPGGGGSYPPASFVLSNQFVNAGTMVITNTGANKSRDLFFYETGGTVTNTATGSIKMIVNGQPATINAVIQQGGFVNAGTFTFMDTPSTTTNLTVTLNQAGATFSNVAGGQVILGPGNQGTATINADNYVNAGTNLLQGGALLISSRTGGVGYMVNSGTILFSGGGLNVDFLTNTASGVYDMTVAGQTINNPFTIASFGTITTGGGTLQNSGTIDLGGGFLNGLLSNSGTGLLSVTNGTTTILSGAVANSGNVNLRSAGTLTGGIVSNLSGGTISAVAGGNISSTVVNLNGATIQATNQTLSFLGNLANGGSIDVAGGKLSVIPAWVNAGTITMSSGGTLTGGNLTNNLSVFGSGTISNLLVNAGAVTVTNGTLLVTTAPINTGSITVADGGAPGTLNVVPAWTNAGFVSIFSGGSTTGGNLTNLASGTVTNLGVINTFVANQGRTVLGGTISNSFLQTSGTTTVSGKGTITGSATVTGGIFDLNGGVYSNGLMVLGGTGVLTNGIAGATFNGGLSNAATVFLGANTFFNGLVTNLGAFTWLGAISNNYAQTAGFNTLNGSSTITGTASVGGGLFNLNGNSYSNGLMIVSGAGVLTDGVAGATFNGGLSNAATVFVSANATFNGVITNTASFTYQGTINNSFVNSGTVALNNNGTFAGTLNNQSSGRVIVTNGTLSILTAPTQNGTIDITLNNTLSATPAWANGGLLRFSGGFLTGGNTTNTTTATILGAGTASNLLVNLGTLIASNGTFNVTKAPVQTGTFSVTSGGTLNVVPAWLNGGYVNMLNGSLIGGALTNAGSISGFGTISSAVINNSGATITASGGGTLTLTATPLQNGIVNILGTLNVASAWSNGTAGTVTLTGGVLTGGTFTVDGTVGGNGTIAANMIVGSGKTLTVNGGTMNLTALTTMDGGVISNGPVVNYGTISGDGTLNAALSNPGYVRATNGLLYIQTLTGNQATGTLEADTGGTLQANGVTPWLNNGQVIVAGGTVIGANINNNTSRIIAGAGTVDANVYNSGQILANNGTQALTVNNTLVNLAGGMVAANNGNLVVNGAFTNAGTFTTIQGLGTFSGTVVNSGAWVTDPTTNVFQNTYTVASSGFIQSSAGDLYIFSNNATTAASFINVSTNNTQYNTLNGDFRFANTLGVTQVFATAGHDFGPSATTATNQIELLNPNPFSLPEYSNNFALGTLEISSFTTVEVDDAFITGGPGTNDGLEAALYLNNLDMGTDSLLIISSNVDVYFITSNNWNLANVQLQGNPNYDQSFDGIHQLVVVPEPAIVLLWLSSIVTVYAARRRNARSAALAAADSQRRTSGL